MPFLTRNEFLEIIPSSLAEGVIADTNAFEWAQAAAASLIVQTSGIAEPADEEATAPAWVKRVAATVIFWDRLPTLQPVDEQTRAWAQEQYRQALAMLKENRASAATGAAVSAVGDIQGLAAW